MYTMYKMYTRSEKQKRVCRRQFVVLLRERCSFDSISSPSRRRCRVRAPPVRRFGTRPRLTRLGRLRLTLRLCGPIDSSLRQTP